MKARGGRAELPPVGRATAPWELPRSSRGPPEVVRSEVDRFYVAAHDSLKAVWPSVEAVAKALLKHEELDREGLSEAMGATDIYTPVFGVQAAHGLRRELRPLKR